MLRVGLLMATRAPIMLHAVRSGAGVDRPLHTAQQDVNQPSADATEEVIQLQQNLPLKPQPRLQPHRQLYPQEAAGRLGMSQGQRSALYPTEVSFTAV
jgi:hypothetical protein